MVFQTSSGLSEVEVRTSTTAKAPKLLRPFTDIHSVCVCVCFSVSSFCILFVVAFLCLVLCVSLSLSLSPVYFWDARQVYQVAECVLSVAQYPVDCCGCPCVCVCEGV